MFETLAPFHFLSAITDQCRDKRIEKIHPTCTSDGEALKWVTVRPIDGYCSATQFKTWVAFHGLKFTVLFLNFIFIIDIVLLRSVLWCCWLGGRKGHPACKNWVLRYWRGCLSGARCKWFARGPADATATPSSLAPVKSILVYLSGVSLPGCPGKRPLNGCSVVVVVVPLSVAQLWALTGFVWYLQSDGTSSHSPTIRRWPVNLWQNDTYYFITLYFSRYWFLALHNTVVLN